eukprot:8666257-Pyramimonas_sp.AAC.1
MPATLMAMAAAEAAIRNDTKKRWLPLAMQMPSTPQWWSKRSKQKEQTVQWEARKGRQMLQLEQYLSGSVSSGASAGCRLHCCPSPFQMPASVASIWPDSTARMIGSLFGLGGIRPGSVWFVRTRKTSERITGIIVIKDQLVCAPGRINAQPRAARITM